MARGAVQRVPSCDGLCMCVHARAAQAYPRAIHARASPLAVGGGMGTHVAHRPEITAIVSRVTMHAFIFFPRNCLFSALANGAFCVFYTES